MFAFDLRENTAFLRATEPPLHKLPKSKVTSEGTLLALIFSQEDVRMDSQSSSNVDLIGKINQNMLDCKLAARRMKEIKEELERRNSTFNPVDGSKSAHSHVVMSTPLQQSDLRRHVRQPC